MRFLFFVLSALALSVSAPVTAAGEADDILKGLFLEEDAGITRGNLVVRIGGVANRFGSAPYKVNFKALIKGGSGRIRSIEWDFGDGETATTTKAAHTFTQGDYVVILRVEDENDDRASAEMGISVVRLCINEEF